MRLSPADFWNLSLAEWRWLAGPETAMTRAEFESLAAAFPDKRASLHSEEGRSPVTKDEGMRRTVFALRDGAPASAAAPPQDEDGLGTAEGPST